MGIRYKFEVDLHSFLLHDSNYVYGGLKNKFLTQTNGRFESVFDII